GIPVRPRPPGGYPRARRRRQNSGRARDDHDRRRRPQLAAGAAKASRRAAGAEEDGAGGGRGRFTSGAAGRNSRLARTVRAETSRESPAILCYYFSYWSGVQSEDFEIYVRGQQQRIIFSFKTEGDLYAIFIGMPIAELDRVRRNIEGEFTRS